MLAINSAQLIRKISLNENFVHDLSRSNILHETQSLGKTIHVLHQHPPLLFPSDGHLVGDQLHVLHRLQEQVERLRAATPCLPEATGWCSIPVRSLGLLRAIESLRVQALGSEMGRQPPPPNRKPDALEKNEINLGRMTCLTMSLLSFFRSS